MSEEIENTEQIEDQPVEQEEGQAVSIEHSEGESREFSEVEKLAMELGWNPEGSKTAGDWIKYHPRKLERQNKSLTEIVNALSAEVGEIRNNVESKRLTELESYMHYYALQGDAENYANAKQLHEEEKQKLEKLRASKPQINKDQAAINDFASRNYNLLLDSEVHKWADSRMRQLRSISTEPLEDILDQVESEMRSQFRSKVGRKTVPNSSTVKSKSEFTIDDIKSPEHRSYYEKCKERGYINNVKEFAKWMRSTGATDFKLRGE